MNLLTVFLYREERSFIKIFVFFGLVVFSLASKASFLEMPDTEEVPEYEEGSMTLDLEVPGVKERDPDPEAGPRLNVKEFRLQGMVEFPELGITRKELIEKVETLRFDLMDEGEQKEGGYTDEELSQLADLIAKIEEQTQGEHVGALEVQQLVFLIREQRRKRGVTLGMIETVADTITRYYRERGFMLAKAYIPKQHVRDGVVTLTLLLGELGAVKVENNKRYSSKQIASVFKNEIGVPVTSEKMEERLYLLNDMPGLAVRGYFQPGSQIGDTELNISVVEEDPFDANIRVDNEGSEFTGEYRVYTDMVFKNPWVIGGTLHLSALATYEPDDSKYGAIRYSRNLFGPRLKGAIGYSENAFVIGLDRVAQGIEDAEIVGESLVSDASLTYVLKRSREKNYSVVAEYRDIDTTLTPDSDEEGETDKTQNMRLGFNFDLVDDKRKMLHIGNLSLINSDFTPGTGSSEDTVDNAQGKVSFFSYDYSMLTFWTPPFMKKEKRVVVKSSGQYAGKALANVNQFSLSGVNKTRAFDVNRSFSDDAIYLGADIIFPSSALDSFSIAGERLGKIIQPFVFFDAAYGVYYPSVNDTGFGEREGNFSDIGFGVNINFKGHLRGSLSYGLPLSEDDGLEDDDTSEKSSGKLYFNLQYSF